MVKAGSYCGVCFVPSNKDPSNKDQLPGHVTSGLCLPLLKLINLWCSLSEKETGFEAVQPMLLVLWSSAGVMMSWKCWVFWWLWLVRNLLS